MAVIASLNTFHPVPFTALPPTLYKIIQKIINTWLYDKNTKLTSGIPTLETLDDVYGTAFPSRTISFDFF